LVSTAAPSGRYVETRKQRERCDGKRYRHQRRIKRNAITQPGKQLIALRDRLPQCSSFRELRSLMRDNLILIHGIGALYVYDTAVRIGAY
jgi:hypothetical protein